MFLFVGKCAQEMLSWDRAFVKKHPGKKARQETWSGQRCSSLTVSVRGMPGFVDFEWSCPSTALSPNGRYHSSMEEFQCSETNKNSSKEEMV